MGKEYLIDTNTVIDYLGNKLPRNGENLMTGVIDDIPKLSVLTQIEGLGFNAAAEQDRLLKGSIVYKFR
jgi:hypothetical protein